MSASVIALVVPALFATVALPAYAVTPGTATPAQQAFAAKAKLLDENAQSVVVEATAASSVTTAIKRDSFGATSLSQLRTASLSGGFSGPSVAAFLKHPPYPHFSLSKVVTVAKKYLGVPYVFGGASPSGFDCSGLVMYVYAQFGVALPHSAAAQASMGKPIARSAARPGDIVVLDGGGHVGIYLGGGRMIDAPEPGRVVVERAIYSSSYYIVRLGI